MRKPKIQQRTERRISAALRLVLVAVLLAAQLSLVFLLSLLLKQRAALAYTILEVLAFAYAVYIWTKPGTTSYKVGWIFLILFLPVVGLILYWLWNGGCQSKRLDLKSCRCRRSLPISWRRADSISKSCGRPHPNGQEWRHT